MAQVLGLGAEILSAMATEITATAGNPGVDRHAPADEVRVARVVGLFDKANEFVTENDIRWIRDFAAQGLLGPGVLPMEVPNVAAADPALADADQHLTGTGFHPRNVHHGERFGGLENQRFHDSSPVRKRGVSFAKRRRLQPK